MTSEEPDSVQAAPGSTSGTSATDSDTQNAIDNPLGSLDKALAYVAGEAVVELPKDLYIPPDALEVFLEAFTGPLDLLLYLIKRQNIDILDINVAEITDQYMRYVDLMNSSQFELAAEYMVMAATLTEIKSRLLLPRQEEESEEEDDPRMQLIRRLQEYERFKQAAQDIDGLPRLNRDLYHASAAPPAIERITPDPDIEMDELLNALAQVLKRSEMYEHHHVQMETLSTREKMSDILLRLSASGFVSLSSLLNKEEGRLGVVVTFLAIMELLKDSLIEIVQSEPFGPIHLKNKTERTTSEIA